jgi:hypothetical protein
LSKPHLEICLKLFNYPGAAVAPEAEMFNNDIVDGPVAVLFAHNVEEAVTARGSNTEKAKRDLQKFHRIWIWPSWPTQGNVKKITSLDLQITIHESGI